MKIVWGMALIACFGLLASMVRADDTRQINGGDVIYSTQAWGTTEREALFGAEGQAVRMLTIECSIPPRGAKVYQQSVTTENGRFLARVQLGVAVADCELANKAQPQSKTRLANPELAEVAKAYGQYLLNHQPVPQSAFLVQARPAPAPYHFTDQELAGAERALDARVAAREGERRRFVSAANSLSQ